MISTTEFEHDCNDSDPVHRLVGAIVGSNKNNAHVIALANRVLSSQIGTNSKDICHDGIAIGLSSTWRRISRKARMSNAKEEIEQLYSLYEKELSANEHSDLPAKVILTLTKLMGKQIPTMKPSPKKSLMERQKKRQVQSKMTAKLTTAENDVNKIEIPSFSTTTVSGSSRQKQSELSRLPRGAGNHTEDILLDEAMSSYQHEHSNHLIPPLIPPPSLPQSDTYAYVSQVLRQSTQRYILNKEEMQQEEEKLLKECLYSLQGIDGERIRYYHRDSKDDSLPNVRNYEGIRIQSPVLSQNILYTGQISETRLGSGGLDALKICGEAGWLYARIKSYIHQVQQDRTKGVVARAFAETLAEQLRDYHSLLTTYETKLPGFTLRQMLVELQGPTFRLKTLAMLVDGMQGLTGGYLLSALYKHSIHGNTIHAEIVQSILFKASQPWFEILYAWTTKGILSDPWNEFFVVENYDAEDRHLWSNKYYINQDLVPIGILDQQFVKPSFNVGKGINFIRRCLLDGQWTMQPDAGAPDTSDIRKDMGSRLGYRYESSKYGNEKNATLKETLRTNMGLVHSHILSSLREENHLMQHLFALKQFLLLGQGDFFSAVMEGLHNEFNLDRDQSTGIKGIYKHSILMIVEGALRSTNAKYLPRYVIERLQVELILGPGEELKDVLQRPEIEDHNDTLADQQNIYDIFMFDYQVPDPVLSIVHTVGMERYKMVFSLLFRLKNIEFMLNFTWRQSATIQHALQTSAQYTGIDLSSSIGYARATFFLRNISILRQSMTHLIVNLKSYLMFEVIEGGWQKLESAIDDATTLDEAIEAHDSYLDNIIRKATIRVPERDDLSQQNVLADQVEIVLKIANDFCSLQEKLFNRSLKEAEITAQKRVEAESRLKQGQWGFDSQLDVSEQECFFGLSDCSIMNEVSKISDEYNGHALILLRALNDRVDGNKSDLCENHDFSWENEDLNPQRFLTAQLDHNNFYANQELA